MNDQILTIQARAEALWHTLRTRAQQQLDAHDERGSVTMEQVLWAVAVIAIVAIVVAAITFFVNTQAAKIR